MSYLRALVLAAAFACLAHVTAASQPELGTEPLRHAAGPGWLRSLEIGLAFVGDEGVMVYFDSLPLELDATRAAESSFAPGVARSVFFIATYSF